MGQFINNRPSVNSKNFYIKINKMFRKIVLIFVILQSIQLINGEADSGYHAPSSSYSAPSYSAPTYSAPTYEAKEKVEHVHNHYYHNSPPPSKPSYRPPKPSYNPPPSYHAPTYDRYAPEYYGHTYYDDDEYIHLNKEEVTRGALLFGAGILKGVIVTGLINSANNGITIGKKR